MKDDEKRIYSSMINVPAYALLIPEYGSYVKVYAELIGWEKDEPKFTCEIDRLNVLQASNIQWYKFNDFISEVVSHYFKVTYKKIKIDG